MIGGGEPEIPGISIGHNGYGAWGLTVFRTDAEDLYVYDINPKNLNQYWHKGRWHDFKIIKESIPIKGRENFEVDLYYSVHGPVTFIDKQRKKGYAVRCGWLEPGGSPYLASLRMNQSKSWDEFRDACNYSNIPGENMIWADKKGNIGWQTVGIAPIRNNFSGLVPIPGNGSYAWNGYLPVMEKPHLSNPKKGYIATANQNVTPEDYEHWNAIGFSWSDPYRGDRIDQVLSKKNDFTIKEMKDLQVDVTSLPAQILIPLLKNISFRPFEESLKENLFIWNFKLNSNSISAAVYVAWEKAIIDQASKNFIPKSIKPYIESLQLKRIIDWILDPKKMFKDPAKRDLFLKKTFELAIADLKSRLGDDTDKWQYGQQKNKHSQINHALGKVVEKQIADKLNLGPLARGGNGYTLGSTGDNYNQSSGASFRIIVNTGDWDSALGTNTPGQSGDPESPFYNNLFNDWAKDRYFPIYFSKEKIKSVTFKKTILTP